MDSGYPTSEVVKTASPEMLALAPNDLPEKIGPFYKSGQRCPSEVRTELHTLMVKVALSVEISVGFR